MDKMNLEMVAKRLAELDVEVKEAADVELVEKATEEKKQLLERKSELETLEERKQKALEITSGKAEYDIKETREEIGMTENKKFGIESEEYRNAWLKNLQGKPLSEVEKRTGFEGGSSVLPTGTANKIMDQLIDLVPMLNEIELFRVPGNINVAVESVTPIGTVEAAGAVVTDADIKLEQVALGGYNINAFVQIGADLAKMSISAFETWLVRKLSEAIAHKVEDIIFNGTGSGTGKGIEKYATWTDTTNAVKWTTALASDDLDTAIGLIPAAYDNNAKFAMRKRTFFGHVIGLQDENNLPVVHRENKTYYIRGYEVVFSDKAAADVIYFGDFRRGIVGNLSSEVQVEKQRNLQYNAWDFLGWGVFDCKPATAGTIIKVAETL